jgi:Aldose 1-epimerase
MNSNLTRREALLGLGVLAGGWRLVAAPVKLQSLPAGAFQAKAGPTNKPMTLDKASFGKLPDGAEADLFTLRNGHGVTLKFTNYGLIVTELWAPDRNGKAGNVVLGFDTLARYLQGHPFFGAIAGRVGVLHPGWEDLQPRREQRPQPPSWWRVGLRQEAVDRRGL